MSIRYTIQSDGELPTVESAGSGDKVEEVMVCGTANVDAAEPQQMPGPF
jgi:hypothetical protein